MASSYMLETPNSLWPLIDRSAFRTEQAKYFVNISQHFQRFRNGWEACLNHWSLNYAIFMIDITIRI